MLKCIEIYESDYAVAYCSVISYNVDYIIRKNYFQDIFYKIVRNRVGNLCKLSKVCGSADFEAE